MMSYFSGCPPVFTYQQRERMRYWGYYLRTRLSDDIDTRYYIDGNNHIGYKLLSQNVCAGQKVRFKLVQFGVWKWQDLQRLQMEIWGPGVPRQLLPLTIIDNEIAEGTIPITAGSGQHDIRVTDRFSQTLDYEPVSKITINAQVPTPTITGLNASYCKDAGAVTLTGSPSGGSFTVDGTSTSRFDPASLGVGSHTVRYTLNQNGCTNATQRSVRIDALPPTPTLTLTPDGLQSSAAVGNQWYVNGTALPGQTSPLLSATQPGAITVSVNVGGCTALSQPFVITATEPQPGGLQIVAYPNPASQSIQLKGLVPGTVRVSAVDLSGKVLSQSWFSHNQGTVSFPINHSFGKVFLLKVENENRISSQRIAVTDL